MVNENKIYLIIITMICNEIKHFNCLYNKHIEANIYTQNIYVNSLYSSMVYK